MRKLQSGIFVAVLLSLVACTQDYGETTYVGAAAGGVLGAGLGAIVGNQTGDTSTGLVVGALAGAAAGGAVGNALEAHEQTIRTQDEAIERQETTIKAQSAELEELRRMRGDTTTGRRTASAAGSSLPKGQFASSSTTKTQAPAKGIVEREVVVASESEDSRARYGGSWADRVDQEYQEKDTSVEETNLDSDVEQRLEKAEAANVSGAAALQPASADASVECKEAHSEASKAQQSFENSQKLFHLRRALRLCPGEASHHSELGHLYLSLNRTDDAAFEFQEALRIDPSNESAREGLQQTSRAASR